MKYSDRLLDGYEPEIVNSYKELAKTSELKTYTVYLCGGQIVRLKAYGYRYEVQMFESLTGIWGEGKTVGRISFYMDYINKNGQKGKSKTYDYHYFKFDDVSAIVREDA